MDEFLKDIKSNEETSKLYNALELLRDTKVNTSLAEMIIEDKIASELGYVENFETHQYIKCDRRK